MTDLAKGTVVHVNGSDTVWHVVGLLPENRVAIERPFGATKIARTVGRGRLRLQKDGSSSASERDS